MKRYLALLIALCMMLGMVPMAAAEEHTQAPVVLTDEDYVVHDAVWADIYDLEDNMEAKRATRPQVISAVAALCAARLCPEAVAYFIPSHASFERGYQLAMDAMGLEPLFFLGMRLGEGSGCPLAFEVLNAACAIINDMATFDEAGINDDYLEDIRKGDKFTVGGNP
jgi:hypothetical protein